MSNNSLAVRCPPIKSSRSHQNVSLPHPHTSSSTTINHHTSSPRLSSNTSFKSHYLTLEILLKESIAKCRIADRILRQGPRTECEQQVDNSITHLAETFFTCFKVFESFLPKSLYDSLESVGKQLIYSTDTSITSLSSSLSSSALSSASSTNLAGHQQHNQQHLSPAPPHLAHSHSHSHSHAPLPLPSSPLSVNHKTYYEHFLMAQHTNNLPQQTSHLTQEIANLKHDLALLLHDKEKLEQSWRDMHVKYTDNVHLLEEQSRVIVSLEQRLLHIQENNYELEQKRKQMEEIYYEQSKEIVELKQEVSTAKRDLEEGMKIWQDEKKNDEIYDKLKKSEKKTHDVMEELKSMQKLYYGLMQSCHATLQKKDTLYAELVEVKQQKDELIAEKFELLRPYTPRPDWENIFKRHESDFTSTLLVNTTKPSLFQITEIMKILLTQERQINIYVQQIAQTVEIQQQMKHDLLKVKRDLEIAIRANIQNKPSSHSLPTTTGHATLYAKPKSTSRYFIALGTGKEIPHFLKANGKIRNRHLSKKDTELVVREIWNRKMAYDKDKGRLEMNLSDYLFLFLKNKYGLPSLVAEWGYNLLDALERYRWDADCEVFLKILVGEIAEEAFYDQTLLTITLCQLFMHLEIIRSERKSGTLPMDYLVKCLKLLFPYKPDEAFEAIVQALSQCFAENSKTHNDYSLLFQESRTMCESPFVEEIRDQHLYEIENFMIQLTEEIILLPHDTSSVDALTSDPTTTGDEGEKDSKVRIYDIQSIWIRLDPQVTLEQINKYIGKTLKVPPQDVNPTMLINPTEFCRNLFAMNLLKHSMNYDPAAPSKLHTIPLPPEGGRADGVKRRQTLNAFTMSELTASLELSHELLKLPSSSSKDKKDKNMLTTPRILRLRSRFGLDSKPDEILFLERGPNYQDRTGMIKATEALDTLANEKLDQFELRLNERNRQRENQEISMRAIQGNGIIKSIPEEKEVESQRSSAITIKLPTSPVHSDTGQTPPDVKSSTASPSPLSNASPLVSPNSSTTSSTIASPTPPTHSHHLSIESSRVATPNTPTASGAVTPRGPITVGYKSSFFKPPEGELPNLAATLSLTHQANSSPTLDISVLPTNFDDLPPPPNETLVQQRSMYRLRMRRTMTGKGSMNSAMLDAALEANKKEISAAAADSSSTTVTSPQSVSHRRTRSKTYFDFANVNKRSSGEKSLTRRHTRTQSKTQKSTDANDSTTPHHHKRTSSLSTTSSSISSASTAAPSSAANPSASSTNTSNAPALSIDFTPLDTKALLTAPIIESPQRMASNRSTAEAMKQDEREFKEQTVTQQQPPISPTA